MIIIAVRYGAVAAVGLFCTLLIALGINLLSARIKQQKGPEEGNTSNGRESQLKQRMQKVLSLLKENPDSQASKKIKLWITLITLGFFQLVIGKILFALLFAIAMYAGIGMYFRKQIKNRMDAFENQLIEALSMITNSVRAGQSLQQALENMIKDTKPPLSTEFENALRQVKLGMPMSEALLGITQCVQSKDLTIVVNSINLARETGGNLGEILSRLAATMKERRKIQGKIVALTAQGKVSGIVMGCVPFLLLGVLYVIEPNMMGLLFSTVLGNIMLFMAVIMVALGMFFIQKIVTIDI